MIVAIDSRRRCGEIMNVGNDNRVDPPPGFQATLSYRVDGNVLDIGELGRKGGIEQIQDTIELISLAFPIKIVVVSNCIDSQFGNQTCKANP